MPERAYGRHPITGDVIAVKEGIRGYFQTVPGTDPDARNKELGVTEDEAKAMFEASLRYTHFKQ